MKFKGDIIITDPCYIIDDEVNPNDWDKCNYGENMEILGIKTYLTRSTKYGDWSCTTFKKQDNSVLGNFCADAGLVSVFLLDEVLKYNPNFDYHVNKKRTTTLIENFDGEINIEFINNKVQVIGNGNIDFYTKQTGM